MSLPRPNPLLLVILDGWGYSTLTDGNAIAAAHTPAMDTFQQYYPMASLQAAGIEVGLPWGEAGNSETGHGNIGSGQIRYQALPRIDKTIENGDFFKNEAFLGAVKHAVENNSRLHLLGLVSPGGVHAHMSHIPALLKLAKDNGMKDNVFIHAITDGRDTPPQSGVAYFDKLERQIKEVGLGKIATVTGRLYAMDRNANWERTEAAYNVMTGGAREYGAGSARQAVEQAYKREVTDEMIQPTAITYGGSPIGDVKDGDAIIFFNYRPDRARQITHAFTDAAFDHFERQTFKNLYFATMSHYEDGLNVQVAFEDEVVAKPLAAILSENNLSQAHIAETEKYAHVTYYMNGGNEGKFPGEDHILVKSGSAKNFADTPEMAAKEITDMVLNKAKERSHDVFVVNYANPDMIAHTGNMEATVKACEVVDQCLRRLYDAIIPNKGAMLITADHGNAESMQNLQTGEMETDHSSNPVPLHYLRYEVARTTPRSPEEIQKILSSPIGVLTDVSPTVLDILQITKPAEMTGISLLGSLK